MDDVWLPLELTGSSDQGDDMTSRVGRVQAIHAFGVRYNGLMRSDGRCYCYTCEAERAQQMEWHAPEDEP